MYVTRSNDRGGWTVGTYTVDGQWSPRSDHTDPQAAARAATALNGTPEPFPARLTLRIPGLPDACGHCGEYVTEWPLAVYGNRLNVTCPHCHTIAAPVAAVRG